MVRLILKSNMPFNDFLKLCTTLRSLYSKEIAQQVFESNVGKFHNLGDFNPSKKVLSVH